MPRVSVVMAAFNAEPYIGAAIDSVLAQTHRDFELIIVDDCSTDRTAEIVEAQAQQDDRIRVLRNRENRGQGYSRNIGIDSAVGEWIAILDSDDWYHHDRLRVLLEQANADGADVVADNQFFMDEPGASLVRRLRRATGRGVDRLTAVDLLRGDRAGGAANLGLLKPMLRRSFLERNSVRYDERRGIGEDFYFLLKCLSQTPHLLFVKRPYYYYRLYRNSWSNTLGIESYAASLEIHRQHMSLFDPATAPTTVRLLERRERRLMHYWRYQRIAVPLKAGDLGDGLKRASADPGILLSFLPAISRYLWRRLTRPQESRRARG